MNTDANQEKEPEIHLLFLNPVRDGKGRLTNEFVYSLDSKPFDRDGRLHVQIGSWDANHWFVVPVGKTVEKTFRKAARFLSDRFADQPEHLRPVIEVKPRNSPYPPPEPFYRHLVAAIG